MTGIKCVEPNKKDLEFIRKSINTTGLSDVLIKTAIDNALTLNPNLAIETLLTPSYIGILRRLIEAERNKKIKEDIIQKQTPMIGKARRIILTPGRKYSKYEAMKESTTLFVYTENLLAQNATSEEKVDLDTLIDVPEQFQKNLLVVNNSTAAWRTDANGIRLPNSRPLTVKVNAVKGKTAGDFTNNNEDLFLESQEQQFVDNIKKLIAEIKQLAESGLFDKIIFPAELASARARLPKKLADDLVDLFEKELGIPAQSELINPLDKNGDKRWEGDWYKVILDLGTKSELKEDGKKGKEEDELLKLAKESLKAERPILDSDLAYISECDMDILTKIFPNIEQRKARVDNILKRFSDKLTQKIDLALQEVLNMDDDKLQLYTWDNGELTFADRKYYLTRGTKAELRIWALENLKFTDSSKSLAFEIFDEIASEMDYMINIVLQLGDDGYKLYTVLLLSSFDDNSSLKNLIKLLNNDAYTILARMAIPNIPNIKQSDIDDIIAKNDNGISLVAEGLANSQSEISENFLEEAYYAGWSLSLAKKQAYARARHLINEYSKMRDPDVWIALQKEMAFDLEFNENIRMGFDGRPSRIKTDELLDAEEDEENITTNKGLDLVKFKLLDPASTLSVRMKKLFASLPLLTYHKDGYAPVFDDLGQKVNMNPSVAFYILLEEFSEMTRPEDMDEICDKVALKYPWFEGIIDIIKHNDLDAERALLFDLDTKREFYSVMRKALVPYVKTDENGMLVRKNRSASLEIFLDELKKTYESGLSCGRNQIFDGNSSCNERNVQKMHLLISNPKIKNKKGAEKDAEIKRIAPIYWAMELLNPRYPKKAEIIKEAISILRGEHPEHPAVSLEALLNNLGINTSNMNLEYLTPYLNEMSDEDITKRITTLWYNKVRTIVDNAYNITNPTEGPKGGFHSGDHLVTKFTKAYLEIGAALTLASDGYTLSMFRFGDTTRNTYAAADFFNDMVNNIHKGTEWIENNYCKFDFFKDLNTGRYYNTLVEQLMENEDIRAGFNFMNVLGLGGEEKANEVGNVDKPTLLQHSIQLYFQGGEDEHGNKFGYFRSPLLSDVAALVMLRCPRESGDGYLDKIIDKLVKVLDLEIERILHLNSLGKNDLNIDFYNKNGKKFCFFPEFEANNSLLHKLLMAEIDNAYRRTSSNAKQFNELRNAILRRYVENLLYGYPQEDGTRLGGKLQRFLESITDKQKKAILNTVNKALKQAERELDKENALLGKIDFELDKDITAKQQEDVDKLLEEFYFNDFYMQSLLILLIGSDLAYYKNFRDFIKRNKLAYACGNRLYARDEYGQPIEEHCLYAEDLDMCSNSWSEINEILKQDDSLNEFLKAEIRGAVNSFKRITSTDGQSFRTMKSFKKIYLAMGGTWTDDMEDAYNRIKSGLFSAKDFLTMWHPIKPFVFSYEDKLVNGRREKVVTLHKNSEYMLNAIYSMLNVAMNKSPELLAIHQFMEDNDIDVLHFHSVVKEGYHSGIDINHDNEHFLHDLKINGGIYVGKILIKANDYQDFLDKAIDALTKLKTVTLIEFNEAISRYRFQSKKAAYRAIQKLVAQRNEDGSIKTNGNKTVLNPDFDHIIPLDDYMIVQPTGDHFTEEHAKALFGSLLRNIVMADLPADFTMTVTIGNKSKTLNRDEAVKYYNTLIVDNLLDAFYKIDKSFSDIKNLQKELFAQMRGNPKFGPDVIAALLLNEEETGFKIPFNSPNLANKIEELILSVFKNRILKLQIKGGNVVLVSNYGLSDELHIQYKTDEKGNKCIDYIPCYLPLNMSDLLKDFMELKEDGHYELNFKKMEKTLGEKNKKILELIGYRIPSEDKYSIMPMRVVGFMPSTSGTTIMLPSDIVTMSGTDFDIDKLFLMMRAFRRETYSSDLRQAYVDWLTKNVYRDNPIVALLISTDEELLEEYERRKELAELNNEDIYIRQTAITNLFNLLEQIETYDDKKVKNLITNKRDSFRGLTDLEIGAMVNESELFALFMQEEGYNYEHKDKELNPLPKYIIKLPKVRMTDGEIDLNEMSKRASKEERDNMLIDTIWNTLTSAAGSKLSMLPGMYANVKHSSRLLRIMHDKEALGRFIVDEGIRNKLREITKDNNYKVTYDNLWDSLSLLDEKTLDDFYELNATVQSPMDILDYVDNHRNLMDGNDLIGIFAINSSSHYKYLELNIKIKDGFTFTVNGQKIQTIDAINSPITGVRIGRTCAEFQAASPDNGKDPCLGDLNANTNTCNRIGFLLRVGFSALDIGVLNNSEKLGAIGEKLLSDKTLKLKPSSIPFDVDISRIVKLAAIYELEEEEGIYNLNREDKLYIVDFAEWLKLIGGRGRKGERNGLADLLSESQCVSKCDSQNAALSVNVAEATQLMLKAEDFAEHMKMPDFMISGLELIVDINLDATNITNAKELRDRILQAKIPRLLAAYTLGLRSGYSLSKRFLPLMCDTALQLLRDLRDLTGKKLLFKKDIKTIKNFYLDLTMYMLSLESLFSTDVDGKTLMEKRNYYIHDFPMKFKLYIEDKDENNKYEHPDIRKLNIINRLSNKTDIKKKVGKGIKFENIGKITSMSRKHYTEELDSMLYMGKEEARLAVDLFMYAYYDNGLNFGHSNYGIFFTTRFMEAMPRYIDKLILANNKLISDPSSAQGFVLLFIINHPDLAMHVKQKDIKYDLSDNDIIHITNPSSVIAGINFPNGNALIISVGQSNALYYLYDETNESDLQYKKLDSIPEGTLYYDGNLNIDEIDYSLLKQRGVAIAIKEDEKKSKDNEDKKSSEENKKEMPDRDESKITEIPDTDESQFVAPKDEDFDPDAIPTEGPSEEDLNRNADAMDAIEERKGWTVSTTMIPSETLIEEFQETKEPKLEDFKSTEEMCENNKLNEK